MDFYSTQTKSTEPVTSGTHSKHLTTTGSADQRVASTSSISKISRRWWDPRPERQPSPCPCKRSTDDSLVSNRDWNGGEKRNPHVNQKPCKRHENHSSSGERFPEENANQSLPRASRTYLARATRRFCLTSVIKAPRPKPERASRKVRPQRKVKNCAIPRQNSTVHKVIHMASEQCPHNTK